MTPAERVKRIMDEAVGSDLSSKEKFEFLPSVKNFRTISSGQEKWLHEIEIRLGLEEEE